MRSAEVTDPRWVQRIHEEAEKNTIGYSAYGGLRVVNTRTNELAALFAGHGDPPPPTVAVAVASDDGTDLFGGALLETPCYPGIATADPERARTLARYHRTLAGMFVMTEYRGRGVGRELINTAGNAAAQTGARFLDGFVDDRNDSVGFYRAVGATVMEHNVGLPERSPARQPLGHPPGVNGHWFYIDLWQMLEALMRCTRCRNKLRYDPRDGGQLACDTCGVPS